MLFIVYDWFDFGVIGFMLYFRNWVDMRVDMEYKFEVFFVSFLRVSILFWSVNNGEG